MTRTRHASRASFACVRCKKDKRRCDISQILSSGDQPDRSCTACRNKNEKCEVRYGEDKRSQRQPNETKVLQRRMQALEEFVRNVARAEGNPSSSRDKMDVDSLMEQTQRAFEDFQNSRTQAIPSPANSSSPNTHMTISISPPDDEQAWSKTQLEPVPNSLRSASFSAQNRPKVDNLTPDSHRSASFSVPSRPNFDTISDDFPSALEEVSSPASIHDFDPFSDSASLFPYSENAKKTTDPKEEYRPSEKELNIRSRMALETFPEPEPIVAYLLDLFWQWQSSHLLVVDRALFLRHRQIWDRSDGLGDRDFYSPCLLYALLALASMISLDKGVTRYSSQADGVAGEAFAKRARALLELELDHPKITTVQAALILGCRYGSMKDNSLGWMYSGIAFRIASKLGLHLDSTKAVASGQMTPEMAELRRRVFWGCHMEDNLFSAYCGRPISFMEWDITVAVPDRAIDDFAQKTPDLSLTLLCATSSLSVLCSKILVGIHRQRRQTTTGELGSKASHLHEELWKWRQGLPEVLKWSGDENKSAEPCVFILQMNFYFALILLHRPFMRFPRDCDDLKSSTTKPSQSSMICATAAANITKLVLNYRRYYNIRQMPPSVVHFIFIAGSIHLVNLRSTKLESHNTLLQSSLEALSEIGKSYPVAEKASLELEKLTAKWKALNLAEAAKLHNKQNNIQTRGVTFGGGGKLQAPHAFSNFLDVDFSPLKEMEGYFDAWSNQQPAANISYDHLDLGYTESGPTLDLGNDWIHDADFGNMDEGTCPWLYT
ncbi:fungal specific transcription factor domain-containing protein [Colletotrichum graminicola]|uniref:Fungal specific transcription factor domain-containing protein n=1 Tax=Colletotrichum graminicola (strain M1.001 / M2 / FGSC 10212) TaxID=645133 RepID=E3QTK4_COLGM|nr:fungal specific transcription factor domain-containing protein [Colletotrichum graminicola M1.001]EFQ34192.1 fungal specific transcription factor domain-containing protein [Colletotrichum graminicola M1.001]WDK18511.1 fungal specific transcription factor domain-containing protein [Colletotrichum graminicola]